MRPLASFLQTSSLRICGLTVTAALTISAWASNPSVSDLLKKGDALDAQLESSAALAVFLEAEKLEPNNADLLRRIAKTYDESMTDVSAKAEKRALAEKGLAYAKRAVAADPKNGTAHLALAICYGRLAPYLDNKTKIAYSKLVKEHTDKALELDPSQDYAYHVLGAWNYGLSDLNPILRAIAKLIYGDLPEASFEAAEKHFKQAAVMAPHRVAHHVELGRTYLALGKTDLARLELNKGLSLPSREKDDAETKSRAQEILKKL